MSALGHRCAADATATSASICGRSRALALCLCSINRRKSRRYVGTSSRTACRIAHSAHRCAHRAWPCSRDARAASTRSCTKRHTKKSRSAGSCSVSSACRASVTARVKMTATSAVESRNSLVLLGARLLSAKRAMLWRVRSRREGVLGATLSRLHR